MRKLLLFLFSIPFAMAPAALNAQSESPEIREKFRKVQDAVRNQYIVLLSENAAGPRGPLSRAPRVAAELEAAYRGEILHIYTHALNGFSVRMSEASALSLSRDPRVEYVVEDGQAVLLDTQKDAPWGLDRIDQRDLPLSTTYTYANTGEGVNVYIVDTGLRTTHEEFEGRASIAYDVFGGDGSDGLGHGTHVAGILGGKTYGAAKGATLHAVRVFRCDEFSCSGSEETIIEGIDWVTANRTLPAVANISLGGPANPALDAAVENSIASGVTYVVGAGNENTDACTRSPARVAEAITVGGTDIFDARGRFSPTQISNFGPCLDTFAPAKEIPSAWFTSDTATLATSGTSMASPHVAGVAAMYLESNPLAPPSAVSDAITTAATPGRVTDAGEGSPNLLLYMGFNILSSANAASFGPAVAPESLAVIHGQDLTGATTVTFDGIRAPLLQATETRLGVLVPSSVEAGVATVRAYRRSTLIGHGTAEVRSTAPGIFTFSQDGHGVPLAFTVDCTGVFVPVYNEDGSPRPIHAGPPRCPNSLVLLGTAWRGYRPRRDVLHVVVDGREVEASEVTYVGRHGETAGLDQLDMRVPDWPRGAAPLVIRINGFESNRVKLLFPE